MEVNEKLVKNVDKSSRDDRDSGQTLANPSRPLSTITALTPEMLISLKQKVYSASRDGMAITIFAMLWNLDPVIIREVLCHVTAEDGQKTTPFLIAARNGEEKVLQMFVKNFNVDMEQTGVVKFDGYVIEGASAMWCAAGGGHLNIVRYLSQQGANINHRTLTSSTPLRAACFDGRLDIVQFLVENAADITIANRYGNTCLMIACYKGHLDVVQFLLEKGANPNCSAHCGNTALHFSSECGNLRIVQALVTYNAGMLKNDYGMTPVIVAAESGCSYVVDYLISLPECTSEQAVDALELLGASYANGKDIYDLSKAFLYLRRAMVERVRHPGSIVRKKVLPPVPAYGNRIECQTLEQLEAIERDENMLHMEALSIRERILGADNPEVPHPVIFRGAVFADRAQFDKCISLWLHAIDLRQRKDRTVTKDLLRFAQVFSQMVHLGVVIHFNHMQEVFRRAIGELNKDFPRMQDEGQTDKDSDMRHEIYQANIHTALYLIAISMKIKKTQAEDDSLHRLVYQFMQHKPLLKNGYTPLHMALDSAMLVDDFHVNDIVKFPNRDVASLLLKCGADANSLDAHRNTPLHIIVRYANPISDFQTLHDIIMLLLDHGAHQDFCNVDGKTAAMAATTGVSEVILRTQFKLSLKCLAAKAVMKHRIAYEKLIPRSLEEFVSLH